MKKRNSGLLIICCMLGLVANINAQQFDSTHVWPLCGRITANPPGGWVDTDGCPAERFGNAAHTDAPFSSTFGPRPLGSENDRYDFHRGVDIATPTGTPIFAISGGTIEIAGNHSSYSDPLLKVRHFRPGASSCSDGGGCYHSYYLHISDWVVAEDESVVKGQLIGYTGASGASGFQHLHFEIRDAPAFDPFSAWQRDSIHPFGPMPYDEANNTSISFNLVDNSNPAAPVVNLEVSSNRYDLTSVELRLLDENLAEVVQTGSTAVNGYHVNPPFFDMEAWNFEYTHKNSSNFPWSHYGQGGPYECPYHTEHGSSYNAGLHMDRQDPNDYLAGEFNGVHMVTNKYWLLGNRDYWLNLEFRELTGPAACIEATAVFAHGDATTTQWGDCSNEPPPNNPPTASFSHACDALDCSFNGSGSSDSDGSVVAWDWDFGDGNTATGSNPDHQFASDGSYTVTLTVTDDDGDTSSMQQQLAVAEPPPPAAITVTLSTNKKANRVSVRWSGATSRKVDVYRDGGKVSTTRNDGSWNDRGVSKGNSYSYRVCEQGSAEACSEDVSITL